MKTKQTKLSRTNALIIRAMAKNRLRAHTAAKALHYSRTNVDYHVARIRKLTGKDPRDFFDMIELLKMADEILEQEEEADNG